MSTEENKCNSCGSVVLEVTKIRCSGLCMLCFKKRNNGFSPSALESIKERGLAELFSQWNEIVRKGVPNVRNPLISQKLIANGPVINSTIIGSFSSREAKFDRNKVLALLNELKSISGGELEQYLSEIETFVVEFSRVMKSG